MSNWAHVSVDDEWVAHGRHRGAFRGPVAMNHRRSPWVSCSSTTSAGVDELHCSRRATRRAGLDLFDGTMEILPERHTVGLVEYGRVETFTDAVAPGALRPDSGVTDIFRLSGGWGGLEETFSVAARGERGSGERAPFVSRFTFHVSPRFTSPFVTPSYRPGGRRLNAIFLMLNPPLGRLFTVPSMVLR